MYIYIMVGLAIAFGIYLFSCNYKPANKVPEDPQKINLNVKGTNK